MKPLELHNSLGYSDYDNEIMNRQRLLLSACKLQVSRSFYWLFKLCEQMQSIQWLKSLHKNIAQRLLDVPNLFCRASIK
jgi:hypothetical protein